jgi:murein DD-endopeptidase MepM/ murein hydrolase activator NlpD
MTYRGMVITQAFGVPNPAYRLNFHPGTDLLKKIPDSQIALASGVARFFFAPPTADPKQRGGGYGNTGTITLPNGDVLFYAHLADNGILVPNGSKVTDGQKVFVTGNSGWITGVHAHIEYRLGGDKNRPVDITKKLPEEDMAELFKGHGAEYWYIKARDAEKALKESQTQAEGRRVRIINAHNALKVDKDAKL